MPIVFVFLAVLFWATIATVAALARLSVGTLRWVASLGHGLHRAATHRAPDPRPGAAPRL